MAAISSMAPRFISSGYGSPPGSARKNGPSGMPVHDPAHLLAEVHVVDGGDRGQPLAEARQGAEREAVDLVVGVGRQAAVGAGLGAVVDDGLVVGDRGELSHRGHQGRSRRTAIGLVHQRPANRQRGGGFDAPGATTARGHDDLDGRRDRRRLLVASASAARRRDPLVRHHSGTLPCLRLGSSSRFERSSSRPATSLMRVSAGSMTSSTKPRSAAT